MRSALLESGIHLLAEVGARQASARGAEVSAGAPHGSMRHHFGSQKAFVLAMADMLFARDAPLPNESEDDVLARWLAGEATEARARLELMATAMREPQLAELVETWQRRYRAHFEARGYTPAATQTVMRLLLGASIEALVTRALRV